MLDRMEAFRVQIMVFLGDSKNFWALAIILISAWLSQ